MRALIFELAGSIGAGAIDIAGRPLLVRQLQWLRELGIEDVVVEVALGSHANERAELLLGSDPLTARCAVLPTRCALGIAALAARAGLGRDELFLALPADTLLHGALELASHAAGYSFAAPGFAVAPPVDLTVRSLASDPVTFSEPSAPGLWALRIADLATAHALSCAALAGQAERLLVHAAELKPGIWLARGARVSEDAVLLPPVLIGADARVFGQARVGPNAIVGRQAVLERDVMLSDASVAAGTLVGEGMRVRQAQVDPRGTTSFADHTRTEIDQPLQLSHAVANGPRLGARLAALLLALLLLLPWVLVVSVRALLGKRAVRKVAWRGRSLHMGTIGNGLLDSVPALYDVVRGLRDLVGVSEARALELEGTRSEGPVRGGALDISAALAPRASTSTLLWMWRWYLENKSAKLDRALWLEQQTRRGPGNDAKKKRAS